MQKKLLVFLICTLLIVTVFPTVSSLDEHNKSNYNKITKNQGCGCYPNNIVYTKEQLMDEISNPLIQDNPSPNLRVIDTPDYFNWMDYNGEDWTTPAKVQGWCGSCWVFAALGVLESVINIKEGCSKLNPDLSEQYVMSCLPKAGSCSGGYAYSTYYYIKKTTSQGNNCNGIIPESCFPYRAIDADGCDFDDCEHDPVLCDEKCENWEDFLIPIVDHGYSTPEGTPEEIEEIKTRIMENGPVATFMMATSAKTGEGNFKDWGWSHNSPDDYYPYNGPIQYVNHLVVIVGWKDSSSIPNGGYWICKNSWGEDFGYNGFFNIEYNSLNINNFKINWVEYDPNSFNNWIPVANAGEIKYAEMGEIITFDGSGSFDHEGEITSWEWDFGDGSSGDGEITTKEYDSEGAYLVNLTVVDNESNVNYDTTWAFIGRTNNPPANPFIDGPEVGNNNTKHEYTFSTTDPENDDVYYLIVWGGSQPTEYWIGPFESGEKINLENTWIGLANYTIRVKAKDIYGFKSKWSTLKVQIPRYKSYYQPNPFIIRLLEQSHKLIPFIRLFFQWLKII